MEATKSFLFAACIVLAIIFMTSCAPMEHEKTCIKKAVIMQKMTNPKTGLIQFTATEVCQEWK